MTQPTPFNLIMISAEMEGCGNTLHRHFDSHVNCFVYPFESQLGTKYSNNLLCPAIHPVRYGYSAFPEGTSYDRALTLIWDEELKVYVRNPQRSKFRDCGLVMSEEKRRAAFTEHCTYEARGFANGIVPKELLIRAPKPFSRAQVVEAYFRSAFDTWENLNRSGQETHYVGYNPGAVLDTDKLLSDFPNAHVIHVVRNVFSAYGDYLKRPYGQQTLEEYSLAWNVAHGAAYNYARKYPGRFHVLRIEDFFADKRGALEPILRRIGLPWDDALLYPSFNGKDLSEMQCPWGTVEKPTTEYNLAMAKSHSHATALRLAAECALILDVYGYEDVMQEIRVL